MIRKGMQNKELESFSLARLAGYRAAPDVCQQIPQLDPSQNEKKGVNWG